MDNIFTAAAYNFSRTKKISRWDMLSWIWVDHVAESFLITTYHMENQYIHVQPNHPMIWSESSHGLSLCFRVLKYLSYGRSSYGTILQMYLFHDYAL